MSVEYSKTTYEVTCSYPPGLEIASEYWKRFIRDTTHTQMKNPTEGGFHPGAIFPLVLDEFIEPAQVTLLPGSRTVEIFHPEAEAYGQVRIQRHNPDGSIEKVCTGGRIDTQGKQVVVFNLTHDASVEIDTTVEQQVTWHDRTSYCAANLSYVYIRPVQPRIPVQQRMSAFVQPVMNRLSAMFSQKG